MDNNWNVYVFKRNSHTGERDVIASQRSIEFFHPDTQAVMVCKSMNRIDAMDEAATLYRMYNQMFIATFNTN